MKKSYLCPKCKKRNLTKNGFKRAMTDKHGNMQTPRTQQWVCRSGGDEHGNGKTYCYSTLDPKAPYRGSNKKPKAPELARKPFKRKIDTTRMMVFTAAQNATDIHVGFHDTLRSFVKANNAELCVIPLRYKNPTSVFTESQQGNETWDERIKDVMYEQRRKLNSNLVAVGDVKIQPTASDPLTGMNSMTHGESAIFGHTKLRMKCVATPQGRMPKIMTTTGAITLPNYTDSKAGKKGDFHHVLGAVVVEIVNDKKFHLYHINARKSDGAFIYMTTAYFPDGKIAYQTDCQAMIFGDAHYRFADQQVVDATFEKGGLVDVLNPKVLVWHDLLDCYFGNPHHDKNPFIKKAKFTADFHIAEDEVRETVAWMQKLGAGRKNYVVASNHDDMFARWVIREDWKEIDPINQEFYLETALQMSRSAKMTDIGADYDDPFAYWARKLTNDPNIILLGKREQLTIAEIYLSNHGDKGPGGARGTIKNLSDIGVKIVTGHGHSPAIQDGHTRVGTMTRLEAEYTSGPGSWLNTHCSIDNFGKRHLHTCIDGRFWL